jgi:nicotinamide phosphoribosyltransferase
MLCRSERKIMTYTRRIYETPRLLLADAYTIGSGFRFESNEADAFSKYYLTFRKGPSKLQYLSGISSPQDDRTVFAGLQRIIERLLSKQVTHEEIDEAKEFLKNRKVTTKGLRDFEFPEAMWRRVVDEFNGFLPIVIDAVPEGTVVYPHEPVIRVYSTVEGFGTLCAWFESKIIHVWAATERLTAVRHWLEYNRSMIARIETGASQETINFLASIMMHDFGDRAAMCVQESEDIPYVHLYCFPGTDTFSAAYQAYKNGAGPGIGSSVDALAHRVVQGFVYEEDCYNKIYEAAQPGDLISMVADCYDYYRAVRNYLLPLALRSKSTGNGKVIVARPDSGDALEQILWTVRLAEQAGLCEKQANGFKYMTTLRIIQGDSMTFAKMKEINDALIREGFAPHGCLIYGVGGFLRNSITRDNLSTKYALCAVGKDHRPVVKKSETPGKATLPNVKVLRDPDSLFSGVTIVLPGELGKDSLVNYYDGTNGGWPFGVGMDDNFPTIQDRVVNHFDIMPPSAGRISPAVEKLRNEILNSYA